MKKNFANALADFFGGSHAETSETGAWGDRFLSETRNLAGHGIAYDQSWRPEGESHSWAMDCSNTTRYLYQVTAGIQLPRTASDQYYYLHLQDKAWDVPTVASGYADCNFLRSNLKPGDLLFWENTYRPDRQPPITHVMIFLGTNAKGQWIMAGSQSSHGGEFNPRRSGPDVYVFDPTHSSGGYTTWLGLVHHKGRFCAYGRPLEADVKKLSVADQRLAFSPGPPAAGSGAMYFLWLRDRESGPHSLEEVQGKWAERAVHSETLYWQEGLPDWTPLHAIRHVIEGAPAPHGPGGRLAPIHRFCR